PTDARARLASPLLRSAPDRRSSAAGLVGSRRTSSDSILPGHPPAELAPNDSAENIRPRLLLLPSRARRPAYRTPPDTASANEMLRILRSRLAGVPAESSSPRSTGCHTSVLGRLHRSRRRPPRALRETLAAWPADKLDETHHRWPCSASRTLELSDARRPGPHKLHTNLPALRCPTRISAARTPLASAFRALPSFSSHTGAHVLPSPHTAASLPSAAGKSDARCDAACAAPSGRF